jgi:hypothetical protein
MTTAETQNDFSRWLTQQIGDIKWTVARRSKKAVAAGYQLFLTQKRFNALRRHYADEIEMRGAMESEDGFSKHLTEPNLDLAQKRKDTFPGMAHWARTGPDGATCRGCVRWEFDGYFAGSGLLKPALCAKYRSLMHGQPGAKVPHYAQACKHFDAAEDAPSLGQPKKPAASALSQQHRQD